MVTRNAYWASNNDGQGVTLHMKDQNGDPFEVRDKKGNPFSIAFDDMRDQDFTHIEMRHAREGNMWDEGSPELVKTKLDSKASYPLTTNRDGRSVTNFPMRPYWMK